MVDELLECIGGVIRRQDGSISTGHWPSVLNRDDRDGRFAHEIGMGPAIGERVDKGKRGCDERESKKHLFSEGICGLWYVFLYTSKTFDGSGTAR